MRMSPMPWFRLTPLGGGGAATSAPLVTIGNVVDLTAERALTGTSNQITVTDNGANGTVVLSLPQNIHTAATPQFARLGLGVAASATVILTVDNGANAVSMAQFYDNTVLMHDFQDGGAVVFNENGNDVDFRIEADTSANGFFFDGSGTGKLLLNSATSYGSEGQQLEVNTTANYGGGFFAAWTTTAGQAPIFTLNRSRSATIGTHTVVQSGDDVGYIAFRGSDGTDFENCVIIRAQVDGTPGNNDMPGRLMIQTSPDGSATVLQRVAVLSTGVTKISSSTTAYGRLGQLFEIDTTANYGGMAINTWSTTDAESGVIDFNKSGSATIGTHTIVADDENLGYIAFRGSNGTSFLQAALIQVQVDGTPGAADMPGRLIFSVTPDGATSSTPRMTILQSGVVKVSTDFQVAYGRLGQPLEIDVSANYGGMALTSWSTTDAEGPLLDLKKSGNATIGSHTAMASGELIGAINWMGSDGSIFGTGALIKAVTEQVWTGTARGTYLNFETTAQGASGNVERVRILGNGTITHKLDVTVTTGVGYTLSFNAALTPAPVTMMKLDLSTNVTSNANANIGLDIPIVAADEDTTAPLRMNTMRNFVGTGAPNNANGTDGDVYERIDGGVLTSYYKRIAGVWTALA